MSEPHPHEVNGDAPAATFKAVQGCPVDLLPEEVAPAFAGCETRIVQVPASRGLSAYYRQEVLYQGAWRRVGQTSLFDDVATGSCAFDIRNTMTIESLLSAGHVYGARIHDDYVSIITHMTDG